jgi:DNA helicase-2/ATP-dependent DNA helicase PcrA
LRSEELIRACLEGCTDPQQEAIRHIEGPLLVIAGPGSGKTRVITRRVGHLVGSGVRPNDILAVTFTNKAAGEMAERVRNLGVPEGATISTFHSLCARMLRIYAKHVGLESSFSIYDTADSLAVVKRVMKSLKTDPAMFKPTFAARQISAAKNKMWTPEDIMKAGGPAETLAIAKIYEEYDRQLRESNAVDFDDLLILMVRLLRDIPDTSDRLGRRFSHVLVDEYQDTNHAQYLIARHLAAAHGNLCVTGDPDQSIYAWRGADIGNILDFEADYPNAKVVRLEQNYRSTKSIVRAADKVITHNLERKIKALWTENPEGEPVHLLCLEDEKAEADTIAEDIARRVNSGTLNPRDVAIFYRLNAQSRVLEAAMRREGLPYRIVAGTEFYQRREIKDLLAYLKLVVNPADEVSLERAINTPPRRIGGGTISRLRDCAASQGIPLAHSLGRAQEAGIRGLTLKGLGEFRSVLAGLAAIPPRPVSVIVERLIDLTSFEEYLRRDGDSVEERTANVQELINAAAEYDQAEPEGTLQGFLEQAALISDIDMWDERVGGVTLMTLHAAKGLEFPAVYIVGLEEGVLPLTRDNGDHDIEEERRLFFVGLTRSKRLLTITFAESRSRYGKTDYSEPSRFIEEMPDEVKGGIVPSARSAGAKTYRRPWNFGSSSARPRKVREAVSFHRVQRDGGEELVYDGDVPFAAASTAGTSFKQGDNVQHPTYGRGKIISVSGYGEDRCAKVQFPALGVKSLMLKYARLKKA